MITKDDVVKDLTHWKAGNGHAFVMWAEEGYCRVAPYLQSDFPNRLFLAKNDVLSPSVMKGQEVMIPPDALKKIQELQQDLESGKKFLKDTHVRNMEEVNV